MMKRLLCAVLLLVSIAARAANFSATLPTYDSRSTTWNIECAVGTATETLAGTANVGAPITFAMGSPGDTVNCQAWTAKGADSSPLSAGVSVHIPLVLTAPVLSLVLAP